jgi:hypothetical protein
MAMLLMLISPQKQMPPAGMAIASYWVCLSHSGPDSYLRVVVSQTKEASEPVRWSELVDLYI